MYVCTYIRMYMYVFQTSINSELHIIIVSCYT